MIGEVLALDYDDCFKPMIPRFLDVVHSETGKRLNIEDAVEGVFPFDEAFPSCGITADEFTELLDLYMLNHSIEGEPFPDAVDAVTQLAQICDVHVVTARPLIYEEVTLACIEKNLGLNVLKGLHVMGVAKGTMKSKKTDTYKQIGANSAADDADHNINAAIEAGLVGFSVQYPGYRHSGHNLDEKAIVVSSLTDVLKYAKVLAR